MKVSMIIFGLMLLLACGSLSDCIGKTSSTETKDYSTKFITNFNDVGIVIGDSIAEGKASLNGEWKRNESTGEITYCDPSKQNEYGQFSYFFEKATKFKWHNHGIGGQTSSEIIARWQKSVTDLNPTIVYVHVGINDFFFKEAKVITRLLTENEMQEIKDNFLFMIKLAKNNNFKVIISDIPYPTGLTLVEGKLQQIQEINNWLKNQEITLIDEYEFSKINSNDKNLYSDGIHLTKKGYELLSELILQKF